MARAIALCEAKEIPLDWAGCWREYLKIKRLWAVILFGAVAGAAQARNDPTPPPSGVVIHLFGPGSITSNLLPGGSAPVGAAPVAAGGAATGVAAGAAAESAAAQPAYQEPTLGQVAHQMFVVGDPSQSPQSKLAVGRTADHP
jgi:hypothetical protein